MKTGQDLHLETALAEAEAYKRSLNEAQAIIIRLTIAATAALDEIDLDYHAHSRKTPACMRLRKMLGP